MARGHDEVVTPEAVVLRPQIAGLGSRFIASLLDVAISTFIAVATVALVAQSGSFELVLAAAIASTFTILGYHLLLEMLWDGRTLGKRAQRIRVVSLDGQPISWSQAVIRNVLRLVDFLPAYYVLGSITILATQRSQRLGDLAAGTMVVHDRRPVDALHSPVPVRAYPWADALDVTALSADEHTLVRSFLRRRDGLAPGPRARLANEIAVRLASRVSGIPDGAADEAIIESVAHRTRSNAPD